MALQFEMPFARYPPPDHLLTKEGVRSKRKILRVVQFRKVQFELPIFRLTDYPDKGSNKFTWSNDDIVVVKRGLLITSLNALSDRRKAEASLIDDLCWILDDREHAFSFSECARYYPDGVFALRCELLEQLLSLLASNAASERVKKAVLYWLDHTGDSDYGYRLCAASYGVDPEEFRQVINQKFAF
jgi:hypothetical protein